MPDTASVSIEAAGIIASLSIPWGLIPREHVIAFAWLAAALGASVPAAFAAILWVQAWRGVRYFGAPRCRECRTQLRGEGKTVPDRCPECGVTTGGVDVDFGMRRWRWWTALRTLGLGACFVGLAIVLAALGGAHVDRSVRFVSITSYRGAIDPTLRHGRLGPAILGSLRYASDAAPSELHVRDAVLGPLRAYVRDNIPPHRGLGLLLDRLGSPNEATPLARLITVDLVGTLVVRGAMPVDEGRAIIERLTAGPRIVVPTHSRAGEPIAVTFAPVSLFALGSVVAVRIGAEGGEPRAVGITQLESDRYPGMVSWACGESLPAGRYVVEVDWTAELIPSPDADPEQKPWWSGATTERRMVDVVDEPWRPRLLSDAEIGAIQSPFLARAQQPIVTWEAVGPTRTLRVEMVAPLRPGIAMIGRWHLLVHGLTIPIAESTYAVDMLRLQETVVVPAEINSLITRVDCVFEPDVSVAAVFSRFADGAWPQPIAFNNLAVSRPVNAR
ncbi:MAG: hypothetical protein SGJ11_17670 [Phycisphaerae bacterium]|nr:hypothetical protein [Phycisphaerae bacterium]